LKEVLEDLYSIRAEILEHVYKNARIVPDTDPGILACRNLRTLVVFLPEKWKIRCLLPLVTSLSLAISFLGQFRGIPFSLAYLPVTVKKKTKTTCSTYPP
jgi:hypothetical protein